MAGTRFARSAEILNLNSTEEEAWAVFFDIEEYVISEADRVEDVAANALFEFRSLKRRKVEVCNHNFLLRSTCRALLLLAA